MQQSPSAEGVTTIFVMLLAIDVIVGPLLSLLVYKENKLKVLDGKQYYLVQDVYLVKREMSLSNRINDMWNVLIHKNK